MIDSLEGKDIERDVLYVYSVTQTDDGTGTVFDVITHLIAADGSGSDQHGNNYNHIALLFTLKQSTLFLKRQNRYFHFIAKRS